MSAWVQALREECERTSQRATADRLGVSPSMINQVLGGTYKASTRHLEVRVRGELMAEQVACPILGEISARACQDHQRRTFTPWNPIQMSVYRACRNGCPHSSLKEGR